MKVTLGSIVLNRGLGALAILALAANGCSERAPSTGSDLLPERLHGLQLVESQSGEEAAGVIARLHQGEVAPRATQIGLYEAEGLNAELYVSAFQTADEAVAQFEAMVSAINEGVEGFGHHTHFEAGGRDVHVVFGNARINYFYAEGERLTWLAVTQPMFA
ncbi:MAG: hypothetical protein PVJ43_11200, partial [Gemmatimonadales bacterium]